MEKLFISEEEERKLICAIQNKELSAFGQLYDIYSDVLLGLITKIVVDKRSSEDVLQQSFVQIWIEVGTYSTAQGGIFKWLCSIVRKNALQTVLSHRDVHDKQKKNTFASEWQSPNREDVQSEKGTLLETNSTQATDLIFVNGFSINEAASLLKMSVSELNSKVRMELQEVRRKLSK